jgi:tetratricopeptide (TPR) repeat protein
VHGVHTSAKLLAILSLQTACVAALAQSKTGNATAAGRSHAQALTLNQQGEESVKAKRFSEAKFLFEKAIRLDRRFSAAYENLALLCLLEGDDRGAESNAVKLLALDPQNYNGRLVAGVAATNQSQFEQGRSYLAPLVAQESTDPVAAAAYAVALQQGGAPGEAESWNARLGRTAVAPPDALLAGQIFRQARLRQWAQKWLEAVVNQKNGSVDTETAFMLAEIYTAEGKLDDASILYHRILQADPNNVDALLDLSEIEHLQGEQHQSDSNLYAAKMLATRNTATLLHFGQVCARRRMYVDARDALQKVVADDSRNAPAWYQLGLAQFRLGESAAAEHCFRTALLLNEQDEWSRIGLGAVLLSEGRPTAAGTEFHRVLQQDGRSAAAYYYLAQIHRDDGKPDQALHELKQSVAYAERDARPLAALGQMQLEQHDLAAAHVSLEKAIALNPAFSTAHYYMAMLLRATGERKEAEKEIEKFKKYRDEENKKGIVGLMSNGKWDYAGFLPAN